MAKNEQTTQKMATKALSNPNTSKLTKSLEVSYSLLSKI